MQHQNILKLRGEIVDANKQFLTLETNEQGADGRVHTHRTPVTMPKIRHGMKVGQRMELLGSLVNDPESRLTYLAVEEYKPTEESTDCNVVKIVGLAQRAFQFFDSVQGKPPFGNQLIRVGQNIIRAVAFGHLSRSLDRNCRKGCTLELFGRIQHRQYTRNDMSAGEILEVHIDHDRFKILAAPPEVDEFANISLGTVDAEDSAAPRPAAATANGSQADDDIPF